MADEGKSKYRPGAAAGRAVRTSFTLWPFAHARRVGGAQGGGSDTVTHSKIVLFESETLHKGNRSKNIIRFIEARTATPTFGTNAFI